MRVDTCHMSLEQIEHEIPEVQAQIKALFHSNLYETSFFRKKKELDDRLKRLKLARDEKNRQAEQSTKKEE